MSGNNADISLVCLREQLSLLSPQKPTPQWVKAADFQGFTTRTRFLCEKIMSGNPVTEEESIDRRCLPALPDEEKLVKFTDPMLIPPHEDFSNQENRPEDEVIEEFQGIIVAQRKLQRILDTISSNPEDFSPHVVCSMQDHIDEEPKIQGILELRQSILTLLNRFDDFSRIYLKHDFDSDGYSIILHRFPEVMDWFNHEKLRLLWRGTRDGFKFADFFDKCNTHRNTLLLIIDTRGNIFGGFSSAQWPSVNEVKSAEDFKGNSFLFTIRNPHGIPPTIFPIRPEERAKAISYGPTDAFNFGEYDISVFGDCHQRVSFTTGFGRCYQNNTGIEGHRVFTGSYSFIVQEVEMLKVSK
jgi:hypothetical protein